MKIEVDIPIEDFENEYWEEGDGVNSATAFIEIIIDKVAEKIMRNRCVSYEKDINKMLSDKINHLKQVIENKITQELSNDSYRFIRDKVSEKVIQTIAEKYERSKQYREIKKDLEIENDSQMVSELKPLISDIVKSEVKKMIKL